MWFLLLLGIFKFCHCDVAHLGYPIQKPSNQLELPHKDYPENPLQISESSISGIKNYNHDNIGQTSQSGNVFNNDNADKSHDHDVWDIRKSIPGEPGQDYPVYDSVPSTSFTCKEKVPGYYADEETNCQVFRICTTNSLKTHNSFLCPNGSLFNQRVLICDWWMNVDCSESSKFYYKNNDIGQMPEGEKLMNEIRKMTEFPKKKLQQDFFTQSTEGKEIKFELGSMLDVAQKPSDSYLPPNEPQEQRDKVYLSKPIQKIDKKIQQEIFTEKQYNVQDNVKTEQDLYSLTGTSSQNQQSSTYLENQKPIVSSVQTSDSNYLPPKETISEQQNQNKLFLSKPPETKEQENQLHLHSKVKITNEEHQTKEEANYLPPTKSIIKVTNEERQTFTQKTTQYYEKQEDGPEKVSLLKQNQNTSPALNKQLNFDQISTGNVQTQRQPEPSVQIPQNYQLNNLQNKKGYEYSTPTKPFKIDQQQNVDKQMTFHQISSSNIQQTNKDNSNVFESSVNSQQTTKPNSFIQESITNIKNERKEISVQGEDHGYKYFNPNEQTFTEQSQASSHQQQNNLNFNQESLANIKNTQPILQNTKVEKGYQYSHPNEQNLQIDKSNFVQQNQEILRNPHFNLNHGNLLDQTENQHNGYQYFLPNDRHTINENILSNSQQNVHTVYPNLNLNNPELNSYSTGNHFIKQQNYYPQYEEKTTVELIRSLGFDLNNEFERNQYFQSVFVPEKSQSTDFNTFLPNDVRYSSYHGVSSYLAPQMSVQQLRDS